MSSQAPYPRTKLCYDEASVRSNKSSRHTALLTWLLAAFCSAWEVSENTLVTWELVRSCYCPTVRTTLMFTWGLTSVQDMGVSMRMPMMMTGLMTSQAAVVSCTSHAPSPEQATSSAPCLPSRASSSVTTSTACQHQVWMRHLTTAIVTCYQLCQLEQAVDGDEAFVVQLGHGGVGGEPRPPLWGDDGGGCF